MTEDSSLRELALHLAIDFSRQTSGNTPDHVVTIAGSFLKFLKGEVSK